jgi:predicted DNA-binding protein (MmcQ/YjbR family)
MGKMFALISENEYPLRINLKCDPDDALALRAGYPAIIPGYHMNKRHWNTLVLDGSLPDELVAELIDHSYILVVKRLRKAQKESLASMG